MFKATVLNIKTHQNLFEIQLSSELGELYMLSLELDEYIQNGKEVMLGFKSSDLILSARRPDISSRNCFLAKVQSVEKGELISVINLKVNDFKFDTMISSNLVPKIKDELYVILGETSLYISEIL